MARNSRTMHCSPDDVFRVLADGWLYPSWVVGASRMRSVDDTWPSEGARLHHSFGVWPVLIDDVTTSTRWDPPHTMVTRPQGWPIGESEVVIDVKPRGEGCVVRLQERAVAGPGRLIPVVIRDLLLHLRNAETLRRLAMLAEGGAGTRSAVGATRPGVGGSP